jgi:hypothetical protein
MSEPTIKPGTEWGPCPICGLHSSREHRALCCTIKPGTRCECRNCGDSHNREDTHRPCTREAVRMVTVLTYWPQEQYYGLAPTHPKDIPMCTTCAAHAEKNTIKPGTRCGCQGRMLGKVHTDCGSCERGPSRVECRRDAVRMVTVPCDGMNPKQAYCADMHDGRGLRSFMGIAMCDPCADWAERHAIPSKFLCAPHAPSKRARP